MTGEAVLVFVLISVAAAMMASNCIRFDVVILRVAAQTQINPSRMLLPMSYAALISGMLTLIATTPNIVVHEELKAAGFDGFGFFSFTPVGLAVLVVAIIYILLVGRHMLPKEVDKKDEDRPGRSIRELWEDFRVGENIEQLRLDSQSPLIGVTIAESRLESRYGVRILGILRRVSRGEDVAAA